MEQLKTSYDQAIIDEYNSDIHALLEEAKELPETLKLIASQLEESQPNIDQAQANVDAAENKVEDGVYLLAEVRSILSQLSNSLLMDLFRKLGLKRKRKHQKSSPWWNYWGCNNLSHWHINWSIGWSSR